MICHQVHRLLVVLMSEGWLVGLIYDGLDSCNVVIVDCGMQKSGDDHVVATSALTFVHCYIKEHAGWFTR